MWKLKSDTNEFIYRTETESQTQKQMEVGGDKLEVWDPTV